MRIKILNIIIIVAVGLIFPLTVIAQSTNQNYILTKTYTASNASIDNIQYYDGLGRPVETVQKQFTPSGKDLVSRVEYDAFGREEKQWLPAPNSKSDGTYNGSTTGLSHYVDSYPYSQTVYEPSPLNRIKNQYGQGQNWRNGSGHKVTIDYMTNSTTDANLKCPYYYTAGNINTFIKKGDYSAGQLYVTKTTDEDDNVSYEFTDKLGRVLLQRKILGSNKYDTNYIYDDYGNLVYILPPVASDALTANQTYNFWSTYNNVNLPYSIYSFTYDKRQRMEYQVLPGAISVPVYDKADRVVMLQTPSVEIPNGTKGRGWLFNKYDVLGRIVLSGIYHGDDSGVDDDNTRVNNMRNLYANVISKEDTIKNSSNYYYTWNTFPSLGQSEVTLVNFYDNYTYATDNAGNTGNLAYQTKSGYGSQHTSAKGLLTGTWAKILDGSGWIKTTYYYDIYGNLVQKRSTNNRGGYDYEYYAYNYNNQMTKKLIEHSAFALAMITEEYTYNYNSKLRLETVNYKFNGGVGVDIAAYQYDDLGRVREKKTGGGMETTTITYNLRGWLKSQTGQRFSENLYYESGHPKGGTTYWGGNVSALTWTDASQVTTRGYSFQYDALGELTNAVYGEGSNLNSGTLKYDEQFSYDKNRNINTLKRYGLKDNNSFGLLDDLTVTEKNGNQIRKVSDAITANQSASDVMEFKFNSDPVNDGHYIYNASGSLVNDYHRRICMIKYNYLSLPQSVQFRRGDRIEYIYDAAGVKRQTKHKLANRDLNYPYWSLSEPSSSDFSQTVTTDYFNNKIYVDNQLKYILMEEGYIEKATGGSTYTAHYYLNDRLGNHRIVIDASGTLKQVNNFYPSGTSIAEYPRRSDQAVQPYKFGGKELDRSNGLDFYDFEARAYNPVLMRFTSIDPMVKKYPAVSPYAYCANNPVRYTDPTGMEVEADEESQKNIRNTLRNREASRVKFDENGRLDTKSLKTSIFFSKNMKVLTALAKSKTIYNFQVADKNHEGKKFHETSEDDFYRGVTEMPGAKNNPSPDSKVYVIVGDVLSEKQQAMTTAHEGFGHAYVYEKTGNTDAASHTYKLGEGRMVWDNEIQMNVVEFPTIPTNIPLEKRINAVVKQAEKNYDKRKRKN